MTVHKILRKIALKITANIDKKVENLLTTMDNLEIGEILSKMKSQRDIPNLIEELPRMKIFLALKMI